MSSILTPDKTSQLEKLKVVCAALFQAKQELSTQRTEELIAEKISELRAKLPDLDGKEIDSESMAGIAVQAGAEAGMRNGLVSALKILDFYKINGETYLDGLVMTVNTTVFFMEWEKSQQGSPFLAVMTADFPRWKKEIRRGYNEGFTHALDSMPLDPSALNSMETRWPRFLRLRKLRSAVDQHRTHLQETAKQQYGITGAQAKNLDALRLTNEQALVLCDELCALRAHQATLQSVTDAELHTRAWAEAFRTNPRLAKEAIRRWQDLGGDPSEQLVVWADQPRSKTSIDPAIIAELTWLVAEVNDYDPSAERPIGTSPNGTELPLFGYRSSNTPDPGSRQPDRALPPLQ